VSYTLAFFGFVPSIHSITLWKSLLQQLGFG
jgi:hypothetical protein